MTEYTAPAKINLGLTILFRYPNGYHHIVSPLTSISFADSVQITFASSQAEFSWENKLPPSYANFPELLAAFDVSNQKKLQDNLFYKAQNNILQLQKNKQFGQMFPQLAKKLQNFPPLKIHIVKRIPSPCGLGGGSSDAAAVFHFYFTELIKEEKLSTKQQKQVLDFFYQAALQTGADVPFFLKPSVFKKQTTLINGIGNTAADKHLPMPFFRGIMGIPKFSFSTAKMYAELKKPLQHDYDSRNSLTDAVACYRDFFYHLFQYGRKKSSPARLKENSLISASVKTDGRIMLLKNEFLRTAQKLFADDAIRLTNGMSLLAQTLLEKFPLEFALTSMSGSGSAFYALFVDAAKEHSQEELLEVVEILKKREPSIHWLEFHNEHIGP